MSRCVICITLALANTVTLLVGFGEITTSYFQVGEFLSQSDIICQTKIVLVGISLHLDSWLIVYLSIERFLALFRPHGSKIIFGRVKTVLYVLTVTLISTALNSFFAINHVSVVKLKDSRGMCNFDPGILNQIRYLLRGQIPLLLVIPCNIVIIGKVMAQYKKMRNAVAVTRQQIQKNKSIKASVLTLSITLSYIAFLLPVNVFSICCIEKRSDLPFWIKIFPMINSSVNFYMYTLTSGEYRKRVKLMLRNAITYVNSFFRYVCPKNSIEPIELS